MKFKLLAFNVIAAILISSSAFSQSTLYFDGGKSGSQSMQTPVDIISDQDGNYIVTGYSRYANNVVPEDIITVKYDKNGKQLWAALYIGPGDGIDMPHKISLDKQGNVYVTGRSLTEQQFDNENVVTIKYSPDGKELWSRIYDKNEQAENPANLVIDSLGNVYVAGYNPNYDGNGFLLKYDQYGELRWSKSIDAFDAVDLVLDKDGNLIYLNSAFDTYKFDLAGNRIWLNNFTPTNGFTGGKKLLTDNSGIYIIGLSEDFQDWNSVVVKCSFNGEQLWVNTRSGNSNDKKIGNASLSANGEVYLTVNYTDSINNLIVRKISANGDSLWEKRTTNPQGKALIAVDMITNSMGDVYVGGYKEKTNSDYFLMKYSSTGDLLFDSTYVQGPSDRERIASMTAFDDNTICITGSSDFEYNTNGDYLTICVDSTGNQKWRVNFDAISHASDFYKQSALDQLGNHYVVGYTYSNSNDDESFLINKYDSTDLLLWSKQFGTPNNTDIAYSVACDSIGNCYVAGNSGPYPGNVTLLKYSPEGVLLWTKKQQVSLSTDHYPSRVVLDGEMVYVGGRTINNNNLLFLCAYDTTGMQLWTKSTVGSNLLFSDLFKDHFGNILLVGSYTSNGSYALVNKYDKAGNALLTDKKIKISNSFGVIQQDIEGNFYMAGTSATDSKYQSITKVDSAWNKLWFKNIIITKLLRTYTIDPVGNIYLISHPSYDYQSNLFITKCDSTGKVKWDVTYDGGDKTNDQAFVSKIDSKNDLWVSGITKSVSDNHYFVLRYDSTGKQLANIPISRALGTPSSYEMNLVESNGKMIMITDIFHPERGDIDIFIPSYQLCSSRSYKKVFTCGAYELNGKTYTRSGIFTDTLSNTYGCDSIIELNLSLFNPNTNITQTRDSLYADEESSSYQWLDCDDNMKVIPGATNRKFIGQAGKSYALRLKKDSCSYTSPCTTFIGGVGIGDHEKMNNVSLFPNPANHYFSVDGITEPGALLLIDNYGKLITQYTVSTGTSTHSIQDLSNGMYQLIFISEKRQISIGKLVKLD